MPAKGYRKHNSKSDRIIIRVTPEEKSRWERTADHYGFKSLSDMIRFLAEDVNRSRIGDELTAEIQDIEIGDGIII